VSVPRLIKNVFANYAGAGISAAVLFFLTPFVIRELGTTGYAVWILVHSIVSYLHIFDLGMHSALVKYAAECPETDHGVRDLQRLVGTLLVLLLAAGMGALLASGAIAIWIVPLLRVPPDWVETLQQITVLLGIDVLLQFVASALSGLLAGRQRYDVLNGVQIGCRLARAASTVILLVSGYGVVALVFAELFTTLGSLSVLAYIVRRLYPALTLSFGLFDRGTWRHVRSYSFWALMNDLAIRGGGELDNLLIPVFLSLSLLTPYSVACSIATVLFWVIEPIVEVLFPFSSELGARNDREKLDRLLVQGSKAAVAAACPFAIVLLFAGESIISNWVGAEYAPEATPVLLLVVPSFLVTAAFSPAVTILTALSRVREVFLLTVLEILCAALLVALSVRTYGLTGLAASYLIANCALSFGGLLPLVCKTVDVPVLRYAREALARPLWPGIPAAAVASLVMSRWNPTGWMGVAAIAALVLVTYFVGFSLLSITRSERAEIFQLATRLVATRAV